MPSSRRSRHAPMRSTPQKAKTPVTPSSNRLSSRSPTLSPERSSYSHTSYSTSRILPQAAPSNSLANCEMPGMQEQEGQEGQEDDAVFTRLQGRLNAMIAECNTALTAQPDPAQLASAEEEERRNSLSRASWVNPPYFSHPSPSYISPYASPYASPQSTSACSNKDRSGLHPPSRIPVPCSPQKPTQPPSSATFAFHMRPGPRSSAFARPSASTSASTSASVSAPASAFKPVPGARLGSPMAHRRGPHSRATSPASVDGDRTPRALSPMALPTHSPTRSPSRLPRSTARTSVLSPRTTLH